MGKKKIVKQSITDILKEEQSSEVKPVKDSVRVKKVKHIDLARIYINATYNNTIITVTDSNGNVLCWASSGSVGFSGPKKATPFAASKVASIISERLHSFDTKKIEIYVKGVGSGRDSAIRSLTGEDFDVILLKDVTPIPHNGPRPPKVRRV